MVASTLREYNNAVQMRLHCNSLMTSLPTGRRSEGYNALSKIAGAHGITVTICRCKNDDIEDAGCCHIAGPPPDVPVNALKLTRRSLRGEQTTIETSPPPQKIQKREEIETDSHKQTFSGDTKPRDIIFQLQLMDVTRMCHTHPAYSRYLHPERQYVNEKSVIEEAKTMTRDALERGEFEKFDEWSAKLDNANRILEMQLDDEENGLS